MFSHTGCRHFNYQPGCKDSFTRTCEFQHHQNTVDRLQKQFLTNEELDAQVNHLFNPSTADLFQASLYLNAKRVRDEIGGDVLIQDYYIPSNCPAHYISQMLKEGDELFEPDARKLRERKYKDTKIGL